MNISNQRNKEKRLTSVFGGFLSAVCATAAIMSLALVGWPNSAAMAATISDDPFFDWTDRAPMPTARYFMGVSVLDGRIYAIGGTQDYGNSIDTVEVYDPDTDMWVSRAPMLTPRNRPTVFSVDGKVYAVGGDENGRSLSSVEVYDPATDSWSSLSDAPIPGVGHAVAVTASGEVYLFGGYPGCCSYYLPDTYRYDPTTDTYTRLANMPNGIEGALAIPDDEGKIYLFGGSGSSTINGHQVYVYDPVGNNWQVRQDMPYPGGGNSASGFRGPDGFMYIFNAFDSGWSTDGNPVILRYNPSDNTWTVDPSAPRRAFLQIAVLAGNGKAYLFGGADADTPWPYVKITALSEGTLILAPADGDGDGVADGIDNCPDVPNPLQACADASDCLGPTNTCNTTAGLCTEQNNNDGDGAGDVCDDDDDNDGWADTVDNCPLVANVGQEDADYDGVGDACDGTFTTDTAVIHLTEEAGNAVATITDVNPPGGNGLVAKLTGNGGVVTRVDNAVSAYAAGFIDRDTYLAELAAALDKLDAFDNQLNAKISTGQIEEPEATHLLDASAEIRATINALIANA